MKEVPVQDKNALLAAFMGATPFSTAWVFEIPPDQDGGLLHAYFKYHSSFDWLIPVYVKIRAVIKGMEEYDDEGIVEWDLCNAVDYIEQSILSGDILQAHSAVYKAILKYWKR